MILVEGLMGAVPRMAWWYGRHNFSSLFSLPLFFLSIQYVVNIVILHWVSFVSPEKKRRLGNCLWSGSEENGVWAGGWNNRRRWAYIWVHKKMNTSQKKNENKNEKKRLGIRLCVRLIKLLDQPPNLFSIYTWKYFCHILLWKISILIFLPVLRINVVSLMSHLEK